MPSSSNKPRVEFAPTRSGWELLARLRDRWPDLSRPALIERALSIAESALAHSDSHPAWTPPRFEASKRPGLGR